MVEDLPPELVPSNERDAKILDRVFKRLSDARPYRHSPPLTGYHRVLAKHLLRKGYRQHDIAYAMETNQGRLSEIKNGHV
ncbi:MAG: hypothetical protein PHW63_03375 [Alphaproteobacteria bacterium]|nr:hypothetical protein [Alphaproteobacteria bacterium]